MSSPTRTSSSPERHRPPVTVDPYKPARLTIKAKDIKTGRLLP
ncbi:hypothetical protein [Streptomyces sp. ISL-12]|nr:hypothetical protein [Streptomyces sp. ISL-12]